MTASAVAHPAGSGNSHRRTDRALRVERPMTAQFVARHDGSENARTAGRTLPFASSTR
jgi:hypothetical protein